MRIEIYIFPNGNSKINTSATYATQLFSLLFLPSVSRQVLSLYGAMEILTHSLLIVAQIFSGIVNCPRGTGPGVDSFARCG